MKLLKDLCLDCMAANLGGNISCITRQMATVHKEQLLQRLADHDRLTPDYLPHITYNLFTPSLRRLVLYRCDQVTDAVLTLLSQCGCRLTQLTINSCRTVTDSGIVAITKGQDELEFVKFKNLQGLTSKGLVVLQSPVLDTLNLNGCGVTCEGVAVVLGHNRNIRNLVLSFCKKLDENVFVHIAQLLGSKLEILKVTNVQCLNDDNIGQLANCCPNLTKLRMYGCNKVTAIGLAEVCDKCLKLCDLDISFCTRITDGASLLCLPPCLRELSLCGLQVTNADSLSAALCRLTSLRVVRLSGVPALDDATLDTILASIGSNLELLDLNCGLTSTLSETALSSIVRHCPSLTGLCLCLLKNITGVALVPLLQDLKRAGRLVHLDLGCRTLDIETLRYVGQNCVNLEELSLSGFADVDDEFLVSVANCSTKLHTIGLKGCRQVTDVGVCALARCHDLRCIVLSGINRLTDRSIMALANNCPHIRELYVSGCNLISRAAIHYLVDMSIPRVFWEHRVPNIDPEMLVAHNLDTGTFCRVNRS